MALWEDNAIADHKLAKIKAAFEQIPGVELRYQQARAGGDPRSLRTTPTACSAACRQMEWINMLRWYGTDAGAHLGNGLVAPLVGAEAFRLHTLIRGLDRARDAASTTSPRRW